MAQESTLDTDGALMVKRMICVPLFDSLIQYLLAESHGSLYYIHPSVTKMYTDQK